MSMCYSFAALEPGGFAVLALLIGISLIALWVRRFQNFPGKRGFLLAHVGMIIWLLAVLGEIQSETLECKVYWAMMAWPGIAFVPTAWAIFLRHYAFSVPDGKSRAECWALVMGPLLVSAAAWTNPLHGLFYGPLTRLEMVDGDLVGVYDHGPLFYAAAAYLYIFLAISTFVVVLGAFRSSKAHRPYFLMMIFVNGVPMVANLSYVVFGITVLGFDPTPFAFSVVLFLFTQMIFANRLFDVAAIASDLLFLNARNPVLVVDGKGDVVGMNESAEALFPAGKLGTPLCKWPQIGAAMVPGQAPQPKNFPANLDIMGRHLSIQVTPMTQALKSQNTATGLVIMLNDVTDMAKKNTSLEEALLQNARRVAEIEALRDDLQRQILLDPLTGLHNRRGLYDTFAQLKAQSGDSGMVVALIDIDHFKSINDRFGHAAGDRVLRDFARALRVHVRPGLPVFRVGGEEFLIIFPKATLPEIEEFIDSIRASLEDGKFVRVREPEQVGFSAGLAQWPNDGADLDAVMKCADDRLYQAKLAGRGRTVSRSELLRLVVSNEGSS